MDICQLNNVELEQKIQKYNGRVVLRADTVKDDSGSLAVFTVQGSSASQMTTAKLMDVTARLPGCAGQAADAVTSPLHPSEHEKRCKIIEASEVRVSRNLDTACGQSLGLTSKILWFLLNEICVVTHLPANCGKDNLYQKKVPNWECLFVHRQTRSVLFGVRG